MKIELRKIGLYLFCLVILFTSCRLETGGKKEECHKISISVVRFDRMLNDYVEFNSFSSLQRMNTEYPAETKILIENIIGLGEVGDDHINGKLKAFFSDPTLRILMKDALAKFEDMEEIEEKFNSGFENLKEEVPTIKIPSIYSQFSALNESVVVTDSLLGFSVDKYLGEDYPLYKRYYYDYQCKSMRPERIVPDCMTFYLMSEYPFPVDGNRSLLDMMMHWGKIHYVVAKILDYKSMEEELGYTMQEAAWCKENKKAVWQYILQNRHLFATDPMIIRKYNKPAPYTAFFGEGSPAMIGIWVGTQLVESFMKNNKDVTIKELLDRTDYQKMLADSKYKP